MCINGIISTTDKINGLVLYKLTKTVIAINPSLEAFDVAKKKVLENHASRDEDDKLIQEEKDGNTFYKFEKEDLDKLNGELEALTEEKVSIELTKISLTDFGKLEINTKAVKGFDIFTKLIIDDNE